MRIHPLILTLCLTAAVACSSDSEWKSVTERTILVAPQKVLETEPVSGQTVPYFQITFQNADEPNPKTSALHITHFDNLYEEGYLYQLRVLKKVRSDQFMQQWQDALSVEYEMIEMVSKTKQP